MKVGGAFLPSPSGGASARPTVAVTTVTSRTDAPLALLITRKIPRPSCHAFAMKNRFSLQCTLVFFWFFLLHAQTGNTSVFSLYRHKTYETGSLIVGTVNTALKKKKKREKYI